MIMGILTRRKLDRIATDAGEVIRKLNDRYTHPSGAGAAQAEQSSQAAAARPAEVPATQEDKATPEENGVRKVGSSWG
jgi:hypothetical protein